MLYKWVAKYQCIRVVLSSFIGSWGRAFIFFDRMSLALCFIRSLCFIQMLYGFSSFGCRTALHWAVSMGILPSTVILFYRSLGSGFSNGYPRRSTVLVDVCSICALSPQNLGRRQWTIVTSAWVRSEGASGLQ